VVLLALAQAGLGQQGNAPAAGDGDWPRKIQQGEFTISVDAPQAESLDGTRLKARSTFRVGKEGAEPLVVSQPAAGLAEQVHRGVPAAADQQHVAGHGVRRAHPAVPPAGDPRVRDPVGALGVHDHVPGAQPDAAAGQLVRPGPRDLRPGIDDGVVLEVWDQGPGIPREQLETIFHPFFTTKETGTGLGLTLVHQMVVEHGGEITVESEVGRGSRFRVALPGVRAELAATGS